MNYVLIIVQVITYYIIYNIHALYLRSLNSRVNSLKLSYKSQSK